MTTNPDDVEQHDRMVALVERMLDLHRHLLEMQIEATDRAIDDLVFDLYDLTPDERAIVEASAGRTA